MELKHKQKQEGQYDTMEKSPASSMKLLSWCGIGSGCRGPSSKERIVTNISIRVSTYINKTKHFRKWEGAAPREVVEETAPVVKL